MMKKAFITTLIAAAAILSAFGAIKGQWRLHPTFDNSILKIIDTPTRTYFMGYVSQYYNGASYPEPVSSLFFYDKEGDEMVSAPQRFDMASTAVKKIAYNRDKGYLIVIYDNQDIDLLHDDGSVSNIAAIKNANIPMSKKVNDISFDPYHDMVWLATDFGYVALNDENNVVAESRNYGEALTSVARLGDYVYLSDGETMRRAPYKDARQKLENYTSTDRFTPAATFYPMTSTGTLVWEPLEDNKNHFSVVNTEKEDLPELVGKDMNYVSQVLPSKSGYTIADWGSIANIDANTNQFNFLSRPDDEKGKPIGATWDMKELFTGRARKGLRSFKLNGENKFVVSRDYMLPNAPNAYLSTEMKLHPRYGMLVSTYGTDNLLSASNPTPLNLIAALKGNDWQPLSYAYTDPEVERIGESPRGIAIDPADDKYIYQGSTFSGLTRMNLEDPNDIIHYTHPADAMASKRGYVKMFDTSTNWARIAMTAYPAFDNDNTLWVFQYNYDDKDKVIFRFLTDADRKASKDAASARPWQTLAKNVSQFSSIDGKFLPLRAAVNKNMLIYASGAGIIVIDHNGTPANGTDDKITSLTKFSDQDGNTISPAAPYQLYEDLQTGMVWILGPNGIQYCSPRNLLQGEAVLNKVKVSRNDGTSLADYLLNGVEVAGITKDSEGRLWIASQGAGLVVTSSDGKTIYEEFTTKNSDIPSDDLYAVSYNAPSNSMVISTDKGICEFFIGGSSPSAENSDQVRAYPNPVTPDYYGWITIDGLPDNSLVKIVDAKGNLVRELGRISGGATQWDGNNLHYTRVQTGVYYILASPGSSDGGESRVGKIMVMN